MSTFIDLVSTPSYSSQILPQPQTDPVPVATSLAKCQTEIADSLTQLRTLTPRGKPDTGSLLNQIARLTSSLARLIEAFAKLKDSMGTGDYPKESSVDTTSTDLSPDNIASVTSEASPEPTSDTSTVSTDSTIDPSASENAAVTAISDATSDRALSTPDVTILPLPSAPTAPGKISIGSTLSKSGDFLWKPISDKDGKLAILLPKRYTGQVKSVKILNAQGTKVLQKGHYSGVGNGDREHFRFSKSGGNFPDGAIVLITLKDGSTNHVTIKDTSARTTV